jgi:hypothetical protein
MEENGRTRVTARRGFFPAVVGRDVQIQEGGGVIFLARRNLNITRGGGQWLIAGHDQHVEQGGGAVLLSRQARVTNGFVGLLVAGHVTLEGNARTLVTISAPVAAVLAAGVIALAALGRRRIGRAGQVS